MNKEKLLKIDLIFFGVLNIFVIPVLAYFYGDIILWQPRNIPTEMMMNGIYISMGLIMIIIARNPKNNKAFLDFVILSSIVHALVMLYYTENLFHIVDVILLGTMGIVPLLLYPWKLKKFFYPSRNCRGNGIIFRRTCPPPLSQYLVPRPLSLLVQMIWLPSFPCRSLSRR